MASGYPYVNGVEKSFASITATIDGDDYYPTAIDYEDSLTPGRVKKSGSAIPAGSTRGEWDGSASLEFTENDANTLIQNLGDSWGLVTFSVQVKYEEMDSVVLHTLPAVRFMKAADSPGGGSDASKCKFDLFLMKPILRGSAQVAIINDAPTI